MEGHGIEEHWIVADDLAAPNAAVIGAIKVTAGRSRRTEVPALDWYGGPADSVFFPIWPKAATESCRSAGSAMVVLLPRALLVAGRRGLRLAESASWLVMT